LLRRTLAAIFAAAAVLAFAGTAFADNCYNASRPGPTDYSGPPLVRGNWVWLPSIGVPVDAWGFGPPSNYLNSGGSEAWLLENTPYCEAGGIVFYNGPRTTDHGIQSGCGFFG
jgi:hypothetical protein